MNVTMNQNADYGNWVPAKILWAGSILSAAAFGVCAAGVLGGKKAPAVAGAVMGTAGLCFTAYMKKCSDLFNFKKGGMMGKMHEYLLRHLTWDGKGRLLDIGCGAGALTLRCAKYYPDAQLTGIDYWGVEWNYAKEQCEKNAEIEGAESRVDFRKGDAAHLDFPDETFDAAVSNFVFHEVRSVKDKLDVVREALRVVKKGGSFAFQDMFAQKALYGDMEEFVRELKKEGISEIHYIGNVEKKVNFVPKYARTPWMISGVGILYGTKQGQHISDKPVVLRKGIK